MALMQAGNAPVRIVGGEAGALEVSAAPQIPWILLGSLAAVALVAIIVAAVIERRRRRARPAGERAFLKMARRLGLNGPARELVRSIAGERGIDPLALLVSPSALAGAVESPEIARWRVRRGWKRVAALAEAR